MKIVGLILGGGVGSRLQPLTRERSKPAVPIAGKFRLVDIPISITNAICEKIFIELFKNKKKVFVPFVKEIVPLIDIKNNFLIIDPPKGLLEL